VTTQVGKRSSHQAGTPIRAAKYANDLVVTLERLRASKGAMKAAKTAAKRSK